MFTNQCAVHGACKCIAAYCHAVQKYSVFEIVTSHIDFPKKPNYLVVPTKTLKNGKTKQPPKLVGAKYDF